VSLSGGNSREISHFDGEESVGALTQSGPGNDIEEKITKDRGRTGQCVHIDGRGRLERGGQITRKRADIPGHESGLIGISSNKSGHESAQLTQGI
jgi:hypothetical protein